MADTQAESRTTGLRARGAETRGSVEAVNAMVRQPRPNKHHARSNAGCSADVQGGERDVRQMRLWFRSYRDFETNQQGRYVFRRRTEPSFVRCLGQLLVVNTAAWRRSDRVIISAFHGPTSER